MYFLNRGSAKLVFLIIFSIGAFVAFSQNTIIRGTITDRQTKEPLPSVNVVFVGTSIGVTTGLDGKFTLQTNKQFAQIQFSYLGYKPVIRNIKPGIEQTIDVRLVSESKVLDEVTVTGDKVKERYRNKNNPAVDLIREVINHKGENRMSSYDYSEYEQYEKLEFALSTDTEKLKKRKLYKKYQFFFENQDTTKIYGKSLLPIYLQETLSDNYYRKDPSKKKTLIKAHKKVSFDDYIDNDGLSKYLNYIYQDIDIYNNNIQLFTNQFLSPISEVAPMFYKFYLSDTVNVDGMDLYELTFVPRNDTDFLFQGMLYITMDGRYAVQGLDMSVNKHINLNWVREMHVLQSFEQNETGRFNMVKSTIMADFGISKEGGGIYGERIVSLKDFKINIPRPDSLYKGLAVVTLKQTQEGVYDEEFWNKQRHDSLTVQESKVYANVDSLQKIPSFRRTMDIATLLLAGYKGFGWWEVGPVNTFYTFNPVEGFRMRFGGRTTPRFNNKVYLETYAAYGFKDKRWKYFLSGTYSFTGRPFLQWPVQSLRLSYQQDTKIPGQELQFVQEDNFLLAFKRGENDKWLYNKIYTAEYWHEFESHFSFKLGFKNWAQEPAGGVIFNIEDTNGGRLVPEVTTTEVSLELRYAPNETFYQGKLFRLPIFNKYPIFSLRGTAGVEGVFGSEYNYQNLTASFFKRFYLPPLGYTDVFSEGSYTFGKVPFPLLSIHRANQTFSYQLQSYNMMNFLEFISDRYVSLHIDHYFNGLFFNRIPLFKKLKFREVMTVKILYGGIRDENRPTPENSLFTFLTNANGDPVSFSLEREPYIEASVGVANILKFFRLDVVKRITYLDNPNVAQWGLRGRFRFDF